MKFCCNYMNDALSDPRTAIKYGPVFREYYIEAEKGRMASYCPFCGTKLPTSVRDEFFDVLEKEHGIETDIGEVDDRIDIPQEFYTDEWWKKRGL